MSATEPGNQPDTGVRLRLYVAACLTLATAVSVTASLATTAQASGRPTVWILAVLWVVTVTAGTVKVGIPARGVGGVPEYTSLLEIPSVFLMVFLDPVDAIALAVTASLVSEFLSHRRDVEKIVFNTSSEAIAIALGGAAFHALAASPMVGSAGTIAAALVAAATYVAVNIATFTGLVAVLSGKAWQALRSREMYSSVLVSIGVATTGVLAALLVIEAPWGLPLVAVPAVISHLHARGRQESLQLAASKEAADAANQAKSGFLSRMSHEMRTPLNSILGFGQLLELDDDLDDTAQEHLGFIMSSGRHLLTIIDEVLDLSQLEAGRMTMAVETVDVQALARETLDLIGPLARERDIETNLVISSPDTRLDVSADPQRLRQVLLNLLSNAVKYNRDAGAVTVTVGRTADTVTIAVADTGHGIPSDDRERLFVPFERLGHGPSNVQGTGLGLSISDQFVAAMGGRLDVASEVGRGSTFTVLLSRVDPVS